MSFALSGLTHCAKCGSPLQDNESYYCMFCKAEEHILEMSSKEVRLEHELNKIKEENAKLRDENIIYRAQLNSAFDRGFIHKDEIKKLVDECLQKYNEDSIFKGYIFDYNSCQYLAKQIVEKYIRN